MKQATRGILFLGTPHFGASKTESLAVIQRLVSLGNLQQPVATKITKELETKSDAVTRLNETFTNHLSGQMYLVCFHETVPQRLPTGVSEIVRRIAPHAK